MRDDNVGDKEPPMPHDQAFLLAEKKIEQAMKIIDQHPFICFAKQFVENKGGNYGA